MYRAARAGEFAAVDPTLASLLGRAPTSLRDVLAAGGDA
jgi:NAD(P)H dehydrogenase (quinone)